MLGSATTGRTQGRSHIRAQLKPGATQPMEIAATTELRGFRPTNPGLVRRCFGKIPIPPAPPSSGFCWLLDGRTIIQLWCTQEKGTGSWRTLSPSAETDELGVSALNGAFRSAARSFPTFKQGKYAHARMASDKRGLPNR